MSQTDKQLAAGQRRSLRAMRQKLLRMAAEWDGVDGFNETQLIELADVPTTEVRGIYAHPDDHAEVKEAAAKIARRRQRVARRTAP